MNVMMIVYWCEIFKDHPSLGTPTVYFFEDAECNEYVNQLTWIDYHMARHQFSNQTKLVDKAEIFSREEDNYILMHVVE